MKNFRLALKFVWPYRLQIVIGTLAAIGVSLLFTVSIGMLIPILQVITSREGISGWVYRSSVEHRMGIRLPQPDDPTLPSVRVRSGPTAQSGPEAPGMIQLDTISPIIEGVKTGLAIKSPAEIAGLRRNDIVRKVDGRPVEDLRDFVAAMVPMESGRPVKLTVQRGKEELVLAITLEDLPWWRQLFNRIARQLPEDIDPASRRVDRRSRLRTLAYIMVVLLGMTILRNILRYINELSIQGASLRAIMDLRAKVYHHLTSLPMSFFGKNGVTDSISRVMQDTGQVQIGFITLFGKTIQEPIIAAGALSYALFLEWRVAVAAILATPLSYLIIRKLGKKMRKVAKKVLVSVSKQLRVLEETMFGLRVVKAYTMEGYERRRFFRVQRQLLKEQLRMRRIDSAVSPLLEVLGFVALGGAVILAAYYVLDGTLDFRKLVAQLALLSLVGDAARKMSNINNRLQQADAAAERVFALIGAEPEAHGRELPKLGPLAGEIRFENVCFRYPGTEALVLNDISLTAKAGHIVAIVGPNGSGKTTLLGLLPKFYLADSGRILWDGRDITAVNLRSLRQQIGLVTQDAVIFADTAEANIRYGNHRLSREQVVAAAKQAYADEFISNMPKGYDSVIGEHGTTLSGGQKQRIALARAILRNPSVLVLDEAMSQVDAESEMKIQKALDEFLVGRTAFVIAHRFSTVRQADQILVMDAGRIVGVGRHDQLMATCPLYRTLYMTQFRDAEQKYVQTV